jgi:cobalt/nickel transport system ATP-binding protein
VSHHIVEAIALGHRYADGTEALRNISFRIHHGESVAIIGANGAGKSTLLQHLNGSLLPTSGEVRIGEIPVCKETLRDIRRTVGMVFQDPDDQLFSPTVGDDVAFGPLNLGLPLAEVEARMRSALEQVEILHLKDKPPYRLSGGEKRRAALATVLAPPPAWTPGPGGSSSAFCRPSSTRSSSPPTIWTWCSTSALAPWSSTRAW